MRRLEEFWFKYYSTATACDENSWLRWMTYCIFSLPLLWASVANELGGNIKIPLIIFLRMFLPFCLLWIIIWIYHTIRLTHER
jgi:hypothetical protein